MRITHALPRGKRAFQENRERGNILSAQSLSFMSKIHAVSLSAGSRRCPLCGSEDVLRSHRRSVVEWVILPPLLLRPFRCRQCSARHIGFFFRRRREVETTAAVVK